MARKADKRQLIRVTRDDDGGLTLHDPASGVVLSVIATNPAASGPIGLYVEAYVYQSGQSIDWQDASRPVCYCNHAHSLCTPDCPITLHTPAHPTFAFYALEDR